MNLNDLVMFAQAVEAGGFAQAARRFGTPKSTLSKRVAALEDSLGVRLIQRSTRSFQLTEVGREFHEHARAALIEVESAQHVIGRRLAEPNGTVRLTASVPTVQFELAPLLPELARLHPKLRLELDATDRFVDVLQEGFDLALRSHFAPLPDSGLVQRPLGASPVLVVASPAYLRERPRVRHASDLAQHDGLLTAPDAAVWKLRSSSGEECAVAPRPRMVANESVALIQGAMAGLGLTCLPQSICSGQLARGELVNVLPRWSAGSVATTLLMPHRRGQLPSVRVVADFLVQRLRPQVQAGG